MGCWSPATCWCASTAQLVTRFEPLEAVLDDSVGQQRRAAAAARRQALQRQASRSTIWTAITPAAYLEFGDAVVHTLSYQEARAFHRPIRGVFVAASGYMFDRRRRAARRAHHRGEFQARSMIWRISPPRSSELGRRRAGGGALRRPSTIRTAASCARYASIGAGFPRASASATISAGYWQCTDLPTWPQVAAAGPGLGAVAARR